MIPKPQKYSIAALAICGINIASSVALAAETNSPAPRYETRAEHDPNGIGTFYMGREIAHVMVHRAKFSES